MDALETAIEFAKIGVQTRQLMPAAPYTAKDRAQYIVDFIEALHHGLEELSSRIEDEVPA